MLKLELELNFKKLGRNINSENTYVLFSYTPCFLQLLLEYKNSHRRIL
jgi:hypothetical protein